LGVPPAVITSGEIAEMTITTNQFVSTGRYYIFVQAK
jgi:hypothetical protein